jgi:hypothetical protein
MLSNRVERKVMVNTAASLRVARRVRRISPQRIISQATTIKAPARAETGRLAASGAAARTVAATARPERMPLIGVKPPEP